MKRIFDRPDNIPYPNRRGGQILNVWQDDANPRGLWRTTSLESFRTETPAWEGLLDLDALAAQEVEDWVWQGGATLPPAHERAIVYLSRGGSDAVVLREFDLSSRKFEPDGFNLPESRSDIVWLDRDTLLLSSSLGAAMATRSGLARTVRLWRRGTDPLTAPVIFEAREDSMVAVVEVDRDAPQESVWFIEHTRNLHATHWLGDRSGPKLRIDAPSDAWCAVDRDWLALKPRTTWTVGGKTYAPDTVVEIRLRHFSPATATSRRCSSPTVGARCKASSGAADGSFYRFSMISSRYSRR